MIKGIPSWPACEFDWGVILATYRFDPIDEQQFQLLRGLSPGERIRVMLDARELAVGLIRGRVRRQHPDMSLRALNLKVLEEIERVKRIRPGPWPVC